MSRALASRYQPILVALHWLLALMIIGLLNLGFFALANIPNSDPKKLDILVWHMTGGMFVLVLMILRFIVRMWSARPATATSASSLLDRLAWGAHYSLYVIVFLVIASGWATGWLISSVFQPQSKPLPDTFVVLPTFRAHAVLAMLLVILIAGHSAAALYHQFVLKDGLFSRMWFGERVIVPADKTLLPGVTQPLLPNLPPPSSSDPQTPAPTSPEKKEKASEAQKRSRLTPQAPAAPTPTSAAPQVPPSHPAPASPPESATGHP